MIGEEAFSRLFAGFTDRDSRPWRYDVHEGDLDEERVGELRELLDPGRPGGRESPHNYIRSVRLLDESGRNLLCIGDHNTVCMFELRPGEHMR